jgi:hypothetical protein
LIFCKTVDKAVSRVVKQYGSRYFSVSHAGDKSREFLK